MRNFNVYSVTRAEGRTKIFHNTYLVLILYFTVYAAKAAERSNMDMEIEIKRLADLLAYLIEKYGNKLDLENLSDPPRPTTE